MEGKYTLKIFVSVIFSLIQLTYTNVYVTYIRIWNFPTPTPPSKKVKKDIERGSKITVTHYSGKHGPTMSHKGAVFKSDFSEK